MPCLAASPNPFASAKSSHVDRGRSPPSPSIWNALVATPNTKSSGNLSSSPNAVGGNEPSEALALPSRVPVGADGLTLPDRHRCPPSRAVADTSRDAPMAPTVCSAPADTRRSVTHANTTQTRIATNEQRSHQVSVFAARSPRCGLRAREGGGQDPRAFRNTLSLVVSFLLFPSSFRFNF